ncbi:MAG: DUF2061 domain-containing protein [Candidatus Bathyarchaeia archaeon]
MRLRNLDSKLRSLVKSISWRMLGVVILGSVAWVFTRNIEQTSVITLTFNGIQVVLYYFHERLWDNVEWGRKKN